MIKAKWLFPFFPFMCLGLMALGHTWGGWWPSMGNKVAYVLGITLLSAVLLGIIQPWREDPPRLAGRSDRRQR
jgi:hypothetical protein